MIKSGEGLGDTGRERGKIGARRLCVRACVRACVCVRSIRSFIFQHNGTMSATHVEELAEAGILLVIIYNLEVSTETV